MVVSLHDSGSGIRQLWFCDGLLDYQQGWEPVSFTNIQLRKRSSHYGDEVLPPR